MKLKTFTAQTIPAAMDAIRQELGDEVLIVSSDRLPNGNVQLVVATEEAEDDKALEAALYGTPLDEHTSALRMVLAQHHTPELLIERLMCNAGNSKRKSTEHLLEDILSHFTFAPLVPTKTRRAFMITGMAGCGKTIAVAKMAVEAVLKKLTVSVITLDVKKAGGIEQLKAFTDVLKLPLKIVEDFSLLPSILATERLKSDLILIDTPALNPYIITDMGKIAELKQQNEGLEALLTLPAGLDACESAEIANSFSRAGCTRLIASKLDLSRSYGNLLYAAHITELTIANYTASACVTEPMYGLTPKTLAGFMVQNQTKGDLF